MKKSTYIDYAVLMAVRSGRKKKKYNEGLMLIAHAFEERLKLNTKRLTSNAKRSTLVKSAPGVVC